MADATRQEAIEWAVKVNADFIEPAFPPPDGWMWADYNHEKKSLVLTAIFTNTEDADILAVDVLREHINQMKQCS